jgi:hypothetical protein
MPCHGKSLTSDVALKAIVASYWTGELSQHSALVGNPLSWAWTPDTYGMSIMFWPAEPCFHFQFSRSSTSELRERSECYSVVLHPSKEFLNRLLFEGIFPLSYCGARGKSTTVFALQATVLPNSPGTSEGDPCLYLRGWMDTKIVLLIACVRLRFVLCFLVQKFACE